LYFKHFYITFVTRKIRIKMNWRYTGTINVAVFGLIFAGMALGLSSCGSNQTVSNATERSFVDSVLTTLTLKDKVGEMTQLTLGALAVGSPYNLEEPQRLDTAKVQKVLLDYRVGSILNCGNHEHSPQKWHEFISAIQNAAASKQSGVPVLYGIDAIHGATYTAGAILGPQQIGLAATWDPELVRKGAENTAREVAASGIPWNFSPVVDLGRDPRWPRFWETFGEDPLLASEMGVAMVQGFQEGPSPIAATLKHFLGYGLTLSGKDRTPAWIPERHLREYFVPSFQACVDAGAMSIMVNSGEINGIPVHSNKTILTDLLRDEMGFEGVVVSDWEDVKYLMTRHRIAHDYKEAAQMAIEAGIDMAMVPLDLEFSDALLELVEEGTISEQRLDVSVRRILTMKYRLGLFDTGGFPPSLDTYPAKEALEGAAKQAALESITLLKNERQNASNSNQPILPLGGKGRIFVSGPTAHSLNALNGGWTGTWQGTDTAYNTPGRPTLVEALEARFGSKRIVREDVSMAFTDEDVKRIVRSIQVNKPAYAVLGLGEMPYTEIVGNINDLSLFANQKELVRAVHATGTPIVAVFIEGRPRTFNDVEPFMDAVVMAYLPGDYGADAIAQVLDGSFNPTGRLPFSWPRYASSHVTYDHKYTEQIDSKFGVNAFNPQFRFGDGLSYSEVVYSNLQSDQSAYGLKDTMEFTVTLSNPSNRLTTEVVHLYSQDSVATITPSVDRLRAFQRVTLEPSQTKEIRFELVVQDLSFVNRSLNRVVEPGSFGIRVKDEVVGIIVR
jgi:beta-glucosidase